MTPRCIAPLAAGVLLAVACPAGAAVFSSFPVADAFVREALPNGNYGGGGALSVSGVDATAAGGVKNGAFDSFLQFSTATAVAAFNSQFGVGLWRISEAAFRLTSMANAGNPIFNLGPGNFAAQWISRDDWQEGTGTPNAPGTTGLTWSQASGLLTPGIDESLGQFNSPGTDTVLDLSLALPPRFAADLMAGGTASFRLTAVDTTTGFNFRSRNFAGAAEFRPTLILTAQPIPEPASTVLVIAAGSLLLRRRQHFSSRLP